MHLYLQHVSNIRGLVAEYLAEWAWFEGTRTVSINSHFEEESCKQFSHLHFSPQGNFAFFFYDLF